MDASQGKIKLKYFNGDMFHTSHSETFLKKKILRSLKKEWNAIDFITVFSEKYLGVTSR